MNACALCAELRARGVTELTVDARAVTPNAAFFALSGARVHGADFAADALARGARAILVEPVRDGRPAARHQVPANAIEVPNLAHDLGAIGAQFYGDPSASLTVVGVTGTNGKTSFVQLLAQASEALGVPSASIGTLGLGRPGALQSHGYTTPDALSVQRALAALKADGAQLVAMEVSSHALDQQRVAGVRFALAAFTNLTRDHLDYHGTMEAYGAAKARLFAWPGLRSAVINVDDPFGAQLAEQIGASTQVWRVGTSAPASIQIDGLHCHPHGLRFALRGAFEGTISSPLLGRFNALNLAQVAVTLHALGHAPDRIASALAQLEPVPGRMNAVSREPLVVVDYAHTPDALEQALGATRQHTDGNLSVVFGCGGDRDRGKRPEMGRIAEALADRVYVTSDNPRSEPPQAIIDEILRGCVTPERHVAQIDRRAAIVAAVERLGDRDALLIAGKGHEDTQDIGDVKHPFVDAQVARDALSARPC
jgi:UDP-N-acetylmuramoyl-L-alanyl-D-glutamate--2,6-diaminopimelate ligase